MLEWFTDGARNIVALAEDQARRLNHTSLGSEHLLLALASGAERSVPTAVLREIGLSYDTVRDTVLAMKGRGAKPPPERLPFTPGARTVMELSLWEARKLHHDRVGSEHLLLGLLDDDDDTAAEALRQLEIDREKMRAAMLSLLDTALEASRNNMRRALPSRQRGDAVSPGARAGQPA
jgi:ATP-dependent Clp protease ATP-binding subunit ClpC